MQKRLGYILIAVLFLIAFVYWYRTNQSTQKPFGSQEITTFDECVAAGNTLLEKYPPECETKDGQTFVQDIGNALELSDEIVVTNPQPGVVITSPVTIEGTARGRWFFEASFPAKILDESGNIIGQSPLQASGAGGEWMTEGFVPFSGTVPFSETDSEAGTLVLAKDNPSGLPENDKELRIPVRFK